MQTAAPVVLGGLQMLLSGGAAAQSSGIASDENQQIQQLIKQQKQQEQDTITKEGQAADYAQQRNTQAQMGPQNAGFASMLLTGTQGLPMKPGASLGGKSFLGL